MTSSPSSKTSTGTETKSAREGARKKAIADLSKHLVTGSERRPLRCLLVDVSRSGLGVVGLDHLDPHTEVTFLLKEGSIALKVMWCRPDSVRKEVFHLGLGSNDPALSLPKLMVDEGLVAKDELVALLQKEPAKPVERPNDITFSVLREALATAHTPDSSAFRTGSLGKLANRYNGYPMSYKGMSVCVLLPKELRPSEASKLDETEAAAREVMIVKAERGDWRRIWPRGDGGGK